MALVFAVGRSGTKIARMVSGTTNGTGNKKEGWNLLYDDEAN